MKKLFALLVSIFIPLQYASARIISGNPSQFVGQNADVVCFGGRVANAIVANANEVCIDSNGDIVDTSNGINLNIKSGIPNNSALGTAAFPWGAVYVGTWMFMSGVTPGAAIGTSPFILGDNNPGRNSSTCGTPTTGNPTMITGTDFAGIITLGTGAAASSACTLAFNPVYVNTPICSIQLMTSANGGGSNIALTPTILPTSIQFNTGLGFPGLIGYICVGQTQ